MNKYTVKTVTSFLCDNNGNFVSKPKIKMLEKDIELQRRVQCSDVIRISLEKHEPTTSALRKALNKNETLPSFHFWKCNNSTMEEWAIKGAIQRFQKENKQFAHYPYHGGAANA